MAGGGVLSMLAFRRPVPLSQLFEEYPFPIGTAFIALALRGFGALQFMDGVFALTRYLTYWFELRKVKVGPGPSLEVIEAAWMIEHFVLAGVLLIFGGSIAALFIRRARV